MGCIQSIHDQKDDAQYIETLTLKRRVTKKVNSQNLKISISVIADQALEDGKVKSGVEGEGYSCSSHDCHDIRSKNSGTRTWSFSEGRRYTKFPYMGRYKLCNDCNEHKKDVLKTKAAQEVKEMCRKCSINGRKGRQVKAEKNRKESILPATEFVGDLQPSVNKINIAAFASFLALTALDLTAPATEAILNNRKNTWIQLAGHPGGFAPAGPNTIWKKRHTKDNSETLAYEQLMEDSAHSIVPMFYREVEYNSEYFIEIEDLLQHFTDPCIMDIKMGIRTFLESEVKNTNLRKDLYDKMVALEPSAPTAEERRTQSVTKLRYMQFREQESSTSQFGFRIEALRTSGEPPNTNLKKVKSKEQIREVFGKFIENNRNVQNNLMKHLCNMRQAVEGSRFFMTHEVIGSSILIIYDRTEKCGTWLIDFSKTSLVEEGCRLDHRSPWQQGNREDGFLFGLDNLIQFLAELEVKEEAIDCSNSCQPVPEKNLT